MSSMIRAACGLLPACALVACGVAAGPPGDRGSGPSASAARYRVLAGDATCPAGVLAGAGTYGGGQPFSFAVVDGPTDVGRLVVTIGGAPWVDPAPDVVALGGGVYRVTGDVVHPTSGDTTAVAFEFGGFTGPRFVLDDVAQIVEAFSDQVPEVDGSCMRFNGGGQATITTTNPLGGTRSATVAISFDVTEDGTADFGEVYLTTNGTTFGGTTPDVAFVGRDLVIADRLVHQEPGQFTAVTEVSFRIDLTNPTAMIVTFEAGTTASIPLTTFFALSGLCDLSPP